MNSYLALMEDTNSEIVKLQECKKALYASFRASLGENNKFARFLTKVLKKKIKCMEKKEVKREAGWRCCSNCLDLLHILLCSEVNVSQSSWIPRYIQC